MANKKISKLTAILSLYSGLFRTVKQHADISVISPVNNKFIAAGNLGV